MSDVQQTDSNTSAPFKRDIDEVRERIAAITAANSAPADTSGLAPDRHPQQDFFIANLLDAAPKDDVATMEHALYSLSKKKDIEPRYFERMRVTPGGYGRPTVWDKDIILFCNAQIAQRINNGEAPSRTLRFQARDLLVFCNRNTGGSDYDALVEALDRLGSTYIKTDIKTGGVRTREGFALIKYKLVERTAPGTKPAALEIELCDWLYRAVCKGEVLTINRDYFRLTGGLERRVYALARKHCGQQPKFEIGMQRLQEKSGSVAPLKKFRFQLRQIAKENALPDYTIAIDDERDIVIFRPRDRAALQRRAQEAVEQGFVTAQGLVGALVAGPALVIAVHLFQRLIS